MRRWVVALFVSVLTFIGVAMVGFEREASAAVAKGSVEQSVGHQANPLSGAPLCDDRAASSYGAEPAPIQVDGGTISRGDPSCGRALLAADEAASPTHDDLQRSPEPPAEAAVLPLGAGLPSQFTGSLPSFPRPVGDEADDTLAETDSPPPKPVPWIC